MDFSPRYAPITHSSAHAVHEKLVRRGYDYCTFHPDILLHRRDSCDRLKIVNERCPRCDAAQQPLPGPQPPSLPATPIPNTSILSQIAAIVSKM